eukprot:Skav233813  [mRNA]  locus=scaffold658:156389:162218:- [translate_table: standard]
MRTRHGMYCCGFLSTSVPDATFAFEGEHAAMIWALIWSNQLSTWHMQTYSEGDIQFTFMFDAQVTGYQAGGFWRTASDKHWQSVMRSCVHILQARHGVDSARFEYTPAHQGEYWNELADCLAKFAVQYPERAQRCQEPDEPLVVHAPPHLKGVKRMPSQRFHAGPLRPSSQQRRRTQLRTQIREVQQQGEYSFAWWCPQDFPEVVQPVCSALTAALQQWLDDPDATTEDAFHNAMLGVLLDLPMSHFQSGRIFMHWVEHDMHDILATSLSVLHLEVADRAHYSLLYEIDCWHYRCKMQELANHLQNLSDEVEFEWQQSHGPVPDLGHLHPIESHYTAMRDEEAKRRLWKLLSPPTIERKLRGRRYLAIHLYSGRRREDDFHAHLQALLPVSDIEVAIVSLDTAISPLMNVHDETLWQRIVAAARQRRVASLLLGPPCESWSSARHRAVESPDEEGTRQGPRPLRSAESPWGLERLTVPELMQLLTGTGLLLKGIFLVVIVASYGGLTICEHPGLPGDPTYASIWRTGLLQMLCRHGWYLKLCAIAQWRYGAPGIKPTNLMYSGVQLPALLRRFELSGIAKPTQYVIGKDSSGAFRTSSAKEYPNQLSKAFACAAYENLIQLTKDPLPDETSWDQEWIGELVTLSATIAQTEWLPDYQPERLMS